MPKKESRKLLATFNEQMEKLFDLLRVVEDIKLSPEVLEPDPVDIAGILHVRIHRIDINTWIFTVFVNR